MFAKIVSLLLLSGIKFVFAFPVAAKLHFSCFNTILITSIGGVAGIIFFSFFWEHVINIYLWFVHSYLYRYPKIRKALRQLKYRFVKPREERRVPFKRKRRYVWLKNNSGVMGIALLTPILLSIPLGTFLAVRFFGRNPKTIFVLSITLVVWSVVISFLVHFAEFRY